MSRLYPILGRIARLAYENREYGRNSVHKLKNRDFCLQSASVLLDCFDRSFITVHGRAFALARLSISSEALVVEGGSRSAHLL